MQRYNIRLHTQEELDAFQIDLKSLLERPDIISPIVWENENDQASTLSPEDLEYKQSIERNITALRIKLLNNADDFTIESLDQPKTNKTQFDKVIWDAFRGDQIVLEESFSNGAKKYIPLGRISDIDVMRNFLSTLKIRQKYPHHYYDYNQRLQNLINLTNLENFIALSKLIIINKKLRNDTFIEYYINQINNLQCLDKIYLGYSGTKQGILGNRMKDLQKLNILPGNNVNTFIQPSDYIHENEVIQPGNVTKFFPFYPIKNTQFDKNDELPLTPAEVSIPVFPPVDTSQLTRSTSLDDLPKFVEYLLQHPDFHGANDGRHNDSDSSSNMTPQKKSRFK